VEKSFYVESDVPVEWQENETFVVWRMRQAAKHRLAVEHASWTVGLAVPDHPAIRLYEKHPGNHAFTSVPLFIKDMTDFEREYGRKTLQGTLHSLRDLGKPSPIWSAEVVPRTLTFQVTGLSGEFGGGYICSYADTIANLMDMVTSWVLRDIDDPRVVSFELLDGSRVLDASQTCSEVGLIEGVVLHALKYFDPPPPLVISSDSDSS
jgi:hypothetical protein